MINETTAHPDTMRSKAAEARDNLTDMAHIAKESVQEKFSDLKDKASEKYDEGRQKLADFEVNMARRVREAPMKSLLIAAGVGVVLGFLWRRS